MLFEHGFKFDITKMSPVCLSGITRKVLLPELSIKLTFLFETTLHG